MKKILSWLIRYRIPVYLVLILPILVICLYQFVHYYVIPLRYVPWSKIHVVGTPLMEMLLLFTMWDFHNQSKHNERSNLWGYGFIFSISNLVLVSLLANYYSAHPVQEAASVKFVITLAPMVKALFLLLTALFFVLGFKTLFDDIYLMYSSGVSRDGLQEDHRVAGRTIVVLLVLFVIGLGLRLYNLDGFPPHVDEYAHTEQALSMLAGKPGDYDRSFATVTVPIYLSFLAFGVSVWAGRFPLVLMNMLAIFPVYFLGRRIHKSIGLICAALYASSPWMIASSRTMREYAIVPLFSYISALLLLELLNWEGLTIPAYFRKNKYRLLASALIFGYLIFDHKSTLKSIMLLYGILFILAILKAARSNLSRRTLLLTVALTGAGLILILLTQPRFYARYFQDGTFIYQQAPVYWRIIVSSATHHGYMIKELGYLILLLGGILAVYTVYKPYISANFTVLFISMAFALNLTYLTYFVAAPSLPSRPRYGLLAECWYLPLMAIVLWLLYRLVAEKFNRLHPNYIFLFMIMLFTNPLSIRDTVIYQGSGLSPVTGNPHYIVAPARDFLASVMTGRDVLVSDIVFKYDNIAGSKLKTQENIRFSTYLTSANTASVIEAYPRGWVAISPNIRAESAGFTLGDFMLDGKQLRYKGMIGDIYIWQWNE